MASMCSVDDYLPEVVSIASGDVFINDQAVAYDIGQRTGARLVDVETAAVAQVASTYSIPWVGIKAISDNVSDVGFEAGFADALRRSTVHTERLIESI